MRSKSVEIEERMLSSMAESAAAEHKTVPAYLASLHYRNMTTNHIDQHHKEVLAQMDIQIKAAH